MKFFIRNSAWNEFFHGVYVILHHFVYVWNVVDLLVLKIMKEFNIDSLIYLHKIVHNLLGGWIFLTHQCIQLIKILQFLQEMHLINVSFKKIYS